jgi:hypothetical protein
MKNRSRHLRADRLGVLFCRGCGGIHRLRPGEDISHGVFCRWCLTYALRSAVGKPPAKYKRPLDELPNHPPHGPAHSWPDEEPD